MRLAGRYASNTPVRLYAAWGAEARKYAGTPVRRSGRRRSREICRYAAWGAATGKDAGAPLGAKQGNTPIRQYVALGAEAQKYADTPVRHVARGAEAAKNAGTTLGVRNTSIRRHAGRVWERGRGKSADKLVR